MKMKMMMKMTTTMKMMNKDDPRRLVVGMCVNRNVTIISKC